VPLLASANTFTGKITFASGQAFPGTLTGITPGTGLTGGGTASNPTLAVDATKVPLLSVPNTFTAPITFVSGQTFPGTGTLTGITAGVGLVGGGTTGNPSLAIDSSTVPFLSAANTFTGVQTINIPSCVIGIICFPPAYVLHSMGTIRSETGLSLGGNAQLQVDAPGLTAGHFIVKSNGNVGIDQSNPATTLDVGGNVNVAGSLQIQGDTPMNAAPHMYLTGYVPGPLGASQSYVPIFTIPSKSISITRVVASSAPNTCTFTQFTAQIDTWDPVAESGVTQYTLDMATASPFVADSGSVSIPIAAGLQLSVDIFTPSCGSFGTAPSNIAVSVEYVML
jgi:hypothetical protein